VSLAGSCGSSSLRRDLCVQRHRGRCEIFEGFHAAGAIRSVPKHAPAGDVKSGGSHSMYVDARGPNENGGPSPTKILPAWTVRSSWPPQGGGLAPMILFDGRNSTSHSGGGSDIITGDRAQVRPSARVPPSSTTPTSSDRRHLVPRRPDHRHQLLSSSVVDAAGPSSEIFRLQVLFVLLVHNYTQVTEKVTKCTFWVTFV